ncbi:MAG: sensor domain-containing diguanylate cyclase [bacterium]|nr:sensor domain-containing diguanylate cyclase [bacterium]
MGSFGPIFRISFGLVMLTSTILMGLDLLGWLPNVENRDTELRIRIAEAVATQATVGIDRGDLRSVRAALRVAVERNEEVLSAGLRAAGGRLMIDVGEHRDLWNPPADGRSTADHIGIPLYRDGEQWSTIELRFQDQGGDGLLANLWSHPLLRILVLVGVVGFFAYGFYLRRTLRHLDPSAVIPTRVQATLDVMTEGVIVIDPHDDVVMANDAFATRFGLRSVDLMGRKASSFGWRDRQGDEVRGEFPWLRAMRDGEAFVGETLTLNRSARRRIVLTVNGAPVLDGWGRPTGAIVTFDDVTELEENRAELQHALDKLEKSRDEIRLQNEELQQLARTDPLTGVANRRSFMEDVEPLFQSARADGDELACLMVDIDHFKRVNDEHGHLTGDEVIRRVADGLTSQLGGSGIVCRYGGEEFCVALPDSTREEAEALGERVRRQIAAPGFTSVPIAASLGVASVRDRADSLTGLIDQADQALYFSKENGRNRLTRFDSI